MTRYPTHCHRSAARQLATLLLSTLLLAGCAGDPRRMPAPVEQRSSGSAIILAPTGSAAIATPQPGYTPSTALDTAPPTTIPEPTAAIPVRDSTTEALVSRATEQAAGGEYQRAAGTLERAIRIAPDDPELWYELARIRLRQGELGEAEELAVKSRSMAADQSELQARNWRLVAVVRQQRGDTAGYEQALDTAQQLENGAR